MDYLDDPDWPKFLEFGFPPSTRNFPDIVRLTTRNFDYKSLKAGILALEFEKSDKTKPLTDISNLPISLARIVVVKKNDRVLKKFVKDLKSIRTPGGEIPALIIDDESDQASVNTSNPKKWKGKLPGSDERTKINKHISDLLKLLPRAATRSRQVLRCYREELVVSATGERRGPLPEPHDFDCHTCVS